MQGTHINASDRIAALAEATQTYADGLADPDLANVYWGKSLGLWQAFEMLLAEERLRSARHERRRPRGVGSTKCEG